MSRRPTARRASESETVRGLRWSLLLSGSRRRRRWRRRLVTAPRHASGSVATHGPPEPRAVLAPQRFAQALLSAQLEPRPYGTLPMLNHRISTPGAVLNAKIASRSVLAELAIGISKFTESVLLSPFRGDATRGWRPYHDVRKRCSCISAFEIRHRCHSKHCE